MTTALVLDALNMAAWTRRHTSLDGLICHTDAGSQGGFQWSSQHLDDGGVPGWELASSKRRRGRCETRCTHRGGRQSGSAIRCSGSGSGSPRGCRMKAQRCRWECHPPLGVGGSVKLVECALSAWPQCLAVTCPSPNVRRSPSSRRKAAVEGKSPDKRTAPRQRSAESCAGTRLPGQTRRAIGPSTPSGTLTDEPRGRRWPSWRPTSRCVHTSRIVYPGRSSGQTELQCRVRPFVSRGGGMDPARIGAGGRRGAPSRSPTASVSISLTLTVHENPENLREAMNRAA